MIPAFPKPSQVRHCKTSLRYELVNGVRIYPDGREVCEDSTAGRAEYKRRTEAMRIRQNRICLLCGKPLSQGESSFDHEEPRRAGGGFRDDRICDEKGIEKNSAVHLWCNSLKGSKRIS